jgi:hypothetical protein
MVEWEVKQEARNVGQPGWENRKLCSGSVRYRPLKGARFSRGRLPSAYALG